MLTGPAGPVRITTSKGQALLLYLAAHPERMLSRSHLAALLWEETGEAVARHNLTSTLNRLRQELPVWPVLTRKESIGWNRAAGIDLDTERFRQAASGGVAEWAEAAALWRGPFLDGLHVPGSTGFADWLLPERQAWENRMLELLARLAAAHEAAADWAALIAQARQALAIDPVQERFHRWLMLALYQSGERAAALNQYDEYRRWLRAEVGLEPDPATTALRDAIAAGDLPRPRPVLHPAGRKQPLVLPLIGREAEMAAVQAALAQAGAGRGRAVLLHGEAGIGKTRLIEAIAWRDRESSASARPWRTILSGHCHAETSDLAFAPVVEALTGVLPRLDLSGLRLAPAWLAEVGRLLPDVYDRLPDLPPPPTLDPAEEKRRLFEGVTHFLAALPGPVLLVVEDLHWADDGTLQLLAYLVRRPQARQVVLLFSARAGELPGAVDQVLRQLEREGLLRWLDLAPLSPAAIHALAAAMIGATDQVFSGRLHAATRGNPLFAVELLRSLKETGAPNPAALDRLQVPATVQAVVHSRLARLAPAARTLLAAAALFPGPAPFALLPEVVGLSPEEALAALEALVRSGIVQETGDARTPAIVFSHDLVRGVVADGLTRARRSALHGQIYRCLVGSGGEEPSWREAEQLAYHAAAGGLWAEGLRWNLQAAEATRRLPLLWARAHCLEQALTCLERLPPTPDRRRQGIDLRLELALSVSYVEPDRLLQWLDPALTAAAALGDDARLTRGRILQATHLLYANPRQAIAVAEEILPVARRLGDQALLADATRVLGHTLFNSGELLRAAPVVEEAIALLTVAGNHLEAALMRVVLAIAYALQGRFDRSRPMIEELVRVSQERQDPAAAAFCLAAASYQATMQGDWAAAVAAAEAADSAARQSGFAYQEYVANVGHGLALAHRGDLAGAITVQRRLLALAEQIAYPNWLGLSRAWMAKILLMAGQTAEAEAEARAGQSLARALGASLDAAMATKVLGEVAVATGRREEGCALLRSALQQFTAIGMQPEAARCHACLAAAAGPESAAHRRQAEAMFRALGMAWDLHLISESKGTSRAAGHSMSPVRS